jgi:CMP/dCMP kinase
MTSPAASTAGPVPVIAIDGPAGSGKSTVARELARRLGLDYLDTGAMYRAVALAALRARCLLTDEPGLARLVNALTLEMLPGRVLLDQEDVTPLIRTPDITTATGPVADSPAVRRRLVEWQRRSAQGRSVVCEGRDQGTIVFPHAACKFFLVADPVERARRRHRELRSRGQEIPFEEVLRAQQERDCRDAQRDIAPMVPAADAIVLDSTRQTPEEVVAVMERTVRSRKVEEDRTCPLR